MPCRSCRPAISLPDGHPAGGLPLSLAFSQAGPGCDVLVAPDILGVLVTTTGTAVSDAIQLVAGDF